MTAPRVFISYSYDSKEHIDWVIKFATDLRIGGIEAILDQWHLELGQDISAFMQRGIIDSSRVLLICSDKYVEKTEKGLGGAGYERLVVTAEVVQNIDTKKFIPVVRNNTSETKVPRFLGPRRYIDFSDDASYSANLETLRRAILGVPALTAPPVGPTVFSGQISQPPESTRHTGPTGVTPSGQRVLDDQWFDKEAAAAARGLAALGISGHMELRFGLHDGLNKSQLDLLTSVRRSEIQTFGWPIGIIVDGSEEFKPKPYGDGIRAEIPMKDHPFIPRISYDYWALRSNGDFFLSQSFFEDQRTQNEIFFNTRIVRVTEALLFASNLYTNLGAPPEARLSVRVTHRGLAKRRLTTSSPNRLPPRVPRIAQDGESQTEIVVILGKIKETLVDDVRRITEPMFMLFDFQKFDDSIYTDIVRRFENGEST